MGCSPRNLGCPASPSLALLAAFCSSCSQSWLSGIYVSEQEPPRTEPLANRDAQRKPALSGTPPVTPASPPVAGEALVRIMPDMFRVTSIALGDA